MTPPLVILVSGRLEGGKIQNVRVSVFLANFENASTGSDEASWHSTMVHFSWSCMLFGKMNPF